MKRSEISMNMNDKIDELLNDLTPCTIIIVIVFLSQIE